MELRSLVCSPRASSILAVVLAAACAEGSSLDGATTTGDAGPGSGGSSASGRGGGGGGPATSGGPGGSTTTTASATTTGGDGGAGHGGEGGRGDGGRGGDGEGGAAMTSSAASTTASTTTSSGGAVDQLCPDGEFAVGVDAAGTLACAPFAASAQAAIAGGCSIYLGHRDECTSCTTAPSKWGWARTGLCANGVGANGTCVSTALNGNPVSLYGLNTTGDVDENDKLHVAFHCAVGDVVPQPGPCAAGEFVSALVDGVATCTPASGLALGRVRTSCHLYFGWRDECNGCTTAPSKWGRVNDTACTNGLGSGNTCTVATLGSETVRLFGLNTGGDVDGNDKLHLGLRCDDATDDAATAIGTCPAGTLVHGVDADGTLRCKSPAPAVTTVFRERCTAYFGLRDNCTGCTTAPSKWGLARANGCANGVGTDNTCAVASLGGASVSLFGLNPDGDVDENDKIHVGFECE